MNTKEYERILLACVGGIPSKELPHIVMVLEREVRPLVKDDES